MFSGSIPALVTPFRDGAIDESALARLVEWQIASGSSALVAVRNHRRKRHFRALMNIIACSMW